VYEEATYAKPAIIEDNASRRKQEEITNLRRLVEMKEGF
jgi:hypothetical protein